MAPSDDACGDGFVVLGSTGSRHFLYFSPVGIDNRRHRIRGGPNLTEIGFEPINDCELEAMIE